MYVKRSMVNRSAVLILFSAITVLAGAQSLRNSSTSQAGSGVRLALPQKHSLISGQDSALREKLQSDKARESVRAKEEKITAQETQARGYWIDPSTGLMWAGPDNGKAVTWHKARKYCHSLRVAGYSEWRLPTLKELGSLVDNEDYAPERIGNSEIVYLGSRVKGGLLLRGDPWSSDRPKNRFGHPYGDGWFFDLATSKPSYDLPYFRNAKYALGVRRP